MNAQIRKQNRFKMIQLRNNPPPPPPKKKTANAKCLN